MYKTAIAHTEGEASYREALNTFRDAYPEYEVRGLKESNNGWIAFIQREAYQNQNVQDKVPAEEMAMDEIPSPEDVEIPSPGADDEPDTQYEAEEGKQGDLMGQLQDALDKVEELVSQIKESEETEDEVRPDFGPEDEEGEEEGEGEGMDLEREKEYGMTLASATAEVEELLSSDSSFAGYRIASVSETKTSFIAKLKK
jgi:hypothetical protein